MINKKSGKINSIIYDNTVLMNKKRTYSIFSLDLVHLLNLICESGETTKSLTIIPTYKNHKYKSTICLTDYKFHIETRDDVSQNDKENFLQEHVDSHSVVENEYNIKKNFYYLCAADDVESFNESIKNYSDYLYELIPIMMKKSKSILKEKGIDLEEKDLYYGWFEFEIHSE